MEEPSEHLAAPEGMLGISQQESLCDLLALLEHLVAQHGLSKFFFDGTNLEDGEIVRVLEWAICAPTTAK